MSGDLKSHEPLAAGPASDASSGSASFSHDVQSNTSVSLTDLSEGSRSIDILQGQVDPCRVLPSSSHAVLPNVNAVCSGGSGQCTTPHLPVRVRGMCNSCYQKEWRKKNSTYLQSAAPQVKNEPKPRPVMDPRILCDEYGVPMLDSFGAPIQVISISHPIFHYRDNDFTPIACSNSSPSRSSLFRSHALPPK
jgi:hypothetical protein